MIERLYKKWTKQGTEIGAIKMIVVSDLIVMETKPEYFKDVIKFNKRLNELKEDNFKKIEDIIQIA